MKLVVLDWRTMTMNGDLSPDCLNQFGDVTVYPLTAPEDAAELIGDAEAVLCNKVLITEAVMKKCPNLRYIGLFATGFNNIDLDCAKRRNIVVCNAGQYSTNAVAQQVFAYILDHYNRVNTYKSAVYDGKWINSETFSYFPFPTHELFGKTLSIIGYGSIGKAVAKIGEAFGMNIIISTRTKPENCQYKVTDMDTAVSNADILTFHCPLTNKTKRLINSDLLSSMKSSAVLINTARGGIVIEKDLAEALNSEKIAAAYLDVLESEPMSSETPLKTAKNCTITPHTAWSPLETRERLLDIVCKNISAWISGAPINKVN